MALVLPALVPPLVMAVAWVLVMRTGHGGWADTLWTFGTGAAALAAIWLWRGDGGDAPGLTEREVLAAGLALLWSGRLGIYLLRRTWSGPEDQRYADLRREWGPDHPRRLFLFLQAQALAAIPLFGAMALAGNRPGPIDGFDIAGVLIFAAGILGAGVADRQLERFKANPKNRGQVCDTGLWSRSRHPNYFFEWTGWLAWPLIAFDPALSYWPGFIAVLAPALMYHLLVNVSGVPPLEAHMERSRPEAWALYKARTPVFFPRLSAR